MPREREVVHYQSPLTRAGTARPALGWWSIAFPAAAAFVGLGVAVVVCWPIFALTAPPIGAVAVIWARRSSVALARWSHANRHRAQQAASSGINGPSVKQARWIIFAVEASLVILAYPPAMVVSVWILGRIYP
jgi:hypothetical protein